MKAKLTSSFQRRFRPYFPKTVGEKHLLPASSSSTILPRSTEYASASHLTAVQRNKKAQANSVRDILFVDVNLSIFALDRTLLPLFSFFSLSSGQTSWRRPPPRIKFWQRVRSGRDGDRGDVQTSTFLPKSEPVSRR